MRKILMALAAAAILAGCSKNEQENVDGFTPKQIKFTNLNDKLTRAANDGNDPYRVYAAWSGGTGWFINDQVSASDVPSGGPERKVHELNVTVHVEGLNNARMPALIDLNGMAGAYNFSGDRSTLQAVSQQFTINNRTYNPGSTTAGTISTTVRTFGIPGQQPSSLTPQPDRQIAMDFFFILKDRDRTVVHQQANVTGLIRYLPGQHGATALEVEVDLPERLPDVEPEGGGSGFDSELIDWDVIDVPLTSK